MAVLNSTLMNTLHSTPGVGSNPAGLRMECLHSKSLYLSVCVYIYVCVCIPHITWLYVYRHNKLSEQQHVQYVPSSTSS